MEFARLAVELWVSTPIETLLGISVEASESTRVEFRVLSVGDGISVFPSDWGFPAPRGVGKFGGMMEGRSSRDSAPRVSTGPKRRFLRGGRRAARPRPEVIPRSRGTGGDFRGRPQNLPVMHSCVLTRP